LLRDAVSPTENAASLARDIVASPKLGICATTDRSPEISKRKEERYERT
jgi:hypothetical protein